MLANQGTCVFVQWRWNASTIACLLVPGSFAWAITVAGMFEIAIPFAVLGVAGSAASWWFGQKVLSQRAEHFVGMYILLQIAQFL